MLRRRGDTSFGPEYERKTILREAERFKANRVNSKGKATALDILKLELTPSRSAFKLAPPMAQRAC